MKTFAFVTTVLLSLLILSGCGNESGSGFGGTTKPIKALIVSPAPTLLTVNQEDDLIAIAHYKDGSQEDVTKKADWRIVDTSVAHHMVSVKHGQFKAMNSGITDISVKYGFAQTFVEMRVTSAQLVSIEIEPYSSTFPIGVVTAFKATGLYNDGTNADLTSMVTWGSANTAIATVNDSGIDKGKVTTVAAGSTQITASLNSIQGVVSVSVSSATLQSLSIEPVAQSLPLGLGGQFKAIGLYSDNTTADLTNTATWTSSDSSIAEVDDTTVKGFALAKGVGQATITAQIGAVSAGSTLTVLNALLQQVQLGFSSLTWASGSIGHYTLSGIYSDGSSIDITNLATWSSSDTSVVHVGNTAMSAGTVTALGQGTSTLTAQYGGESASVTVTITAATLQSLSVSPATLNLANGNDQRLTVTGHYSDGSTQDVSDSVTWSSTNTSVITVSNAMGSKGQVESQGVGSAQVVASYAGVSINTDVTISAATLVSLQISPSSLSLAAGTSQQITVTGLYSDGSTFDLSSSAVWTSSDASVLAISNAAGSQGTVTAMGVGNATLTANVNGTTVQLSASGSSATLTSLAVTPNMQSIPKGEGLNFTATATYSDGSHQNVTTQASWSIGNTSLGSISNAAGTHGHLVALDEGSTTVNASFGGQSAQVSIDITAAVLQSIAFNVADVNLPQGSTYQLALSGTYSDGSVRDLTESAVWTSDDNLIATVSNSVGSRGRITGSGVGQAEVTATVSGLSLQIDVTTNSATLVSMQITPPSVTLARGLSQNLAVMGTYTDGSVVDLTSTAVWSSSNSGNVSVSNAAGTKGLAYAANLGNATLTATIGSVSATSSFTTSAASLVRVEVNPTSVSLAAGLNQSITVTGIYSDSTTVDLTAQATWSSSNSAVATVSNAAGTQGQVTAVGVGSTQLSVSYGGQSTQFNVAVTAATLVSLDVSSSQTSFAAGTTQSLSVLGTYTDGSTQPLTNSVSWSSSDSSVASVSNAAGTKGMVTGLHTGNVTISASLNGVSDTIALDVTTAVLVSMSISPTSASIAKGLSQNFTVTGTYSDSTTADLTATAVWSSSASGLASVSNVAGSKGQVSALAVGTASITATVGGVSNSISVDVTAATLVSIAISQPVSSLAKGLGQQLSAIGTYTDASTANITTSVVWASSDTSKATISNTVGTKGWVIGAGVGTNVGLTASLGGVTSNTLSFDVTAATLVSLTVTPANTYNLLLAWRNLSAIGTYTDGSTQDLTQVANWTTNNGLVFLDNVAPNKGRIRGLNLGTTVVTATVGIHSANTNFYGVLSL